jgi:quinol monooxygenase YgiN
MFIFYSIHYPRPEAEAQMAEGMHEYGELMRRQPGNIFVAPYPFKNPEQGTLMGISIWESEEAFQAALPIIQSARKAVPPAEWEVRPTEVYMLHSVR